MLRYSLTIRIANQFQFTNTKFLYPSLLKNLLYDSLRHLGYRQEKDRNGPYDTIIDVILFS